MLFAYPKSRKTFITLIGITALLVILLLAFFRPEVPEDRYILAVVVASLGAFISLSIARLIMNSEILALRYLLESAEKLDKCATELAVSAKRMRKGSNDRFQTAILASDAMNAIGQSDEAIEFLRTIAMERPTAERTTSFLMNAFRYSLSMQDRKSAEEYLEKLHKALEGLPKGITKGIYEKELRPFENYLNGDTSLLEKRRNETDSELIRQEATRLLEISSLHHS